MKTLKYLSTVALAASMLILQPAQAEDIAVKITPDMDKVTVKHNGKDVSIMRNQDQGNTVNPAFAKTSRKCPPFCIRPIKVDPKVETYGELEVIDAAVKQSNGEAVMLVDNRTPDWHKGGTIPGATNIPFNKLNRSKGADEVTLAESLEMFGAVETSDGWDFSKAKTLVMFCNGMWCGQSPLGIAGLLDVGYPAEKIKWYRGGMQSWEILGLTVMKP